MKVVLVAFKVEAENSILYVKLDQGKWNHADINFWDNLGQVLGQAADKGADFVSIRFIKAQAVTTVGMEAARQRLAK